MRVAKLNHIFAPAGGGLPCSSAAVGPTIPHDPWQPPVLKKPF